MRALIVGCGYVGLPLGAALTKAGHEVWGLRRTRVAETALRSAGIHPLVADLTDPASLQHLPGPFDWVVQCAAAGGGPTEYRQVYVEGTRNLLSWFAEQPPKRFVYTSSTSVYGQKDGSWVTEQSATEPATEKGEILLEAERLLLEAHRSRGFPATVLRLAGIYGPERGYWFKQFVNGQAKLDGDGLRFLNMIHRDDVVAAIRVALEHGKPGEIYNGVDDEPVSQRDLLGWLSETLGKPMPPSMPPDDSLRKRGTTNKRVSNRKLKEQLDCVLAYPTFREGFKTLLNSPS